jgi:hypothetical protein
MSAIPFNSISTSRETFRRRCAVASPALIYPEGEERRERAERAANFDDLDSASRTAARSISRLPSG